MATQGTRFARVLRAAREGADWAWAELYDAYAGLVKGYLYSRRAPEPEDLTGEVFLKLVRSLDTFEGDEREFRSWLLTITHHTMIDAFRRRARHREDPTPSDKLRHLGPVSHSEPSAMEQLTTEELLEVLEVLTEEQREVLVMRLLAGLSTREIAEIVGKTRGAVKQLQWRAIERLREVLNDGDREPDRLTALLAGRGGRP